jgi:hypothetical protein
MITSPFVGSNPENCARPPFSECIGPLAQAEYSINFVPQNSAASGVASPRLRHRIGGLGRPPPC